MIPSLSVAFLRALEAVCIHPWPFEVFRMAELGNKKHPVSLGKPEVGFMPLKDIMRAEETPGFRNIF